MAIWLTRAGKYGEFEERFLSSSRVFATFHEVQDATLEGAALEQLKDYVRRHHPDVSERTIASWAGQLFAFQNTMNEGDLVVIPLRGRSAFAVGEITGPAQYDPAAENMYRHSRSVRWLDKSLRRSAIEPDLLHSFGAMLSISQPRAEDAEIRLRRLLKAPGASIPTARSKGAPTELDVEVVETPFDLEQDGFDEIARLILRKFKGERMEKLVEAILGAQGYLTFHSPKGRDKGVDLLAAPMPLGFGHPRICVQVKATESPIDRPTLDQLIGTMHNFGAEQGLLVSWGGFTRAAEEAVPQHFFKVRLWDNRLPVAD